MSNHKSRIWSENLEPRVMLAGPQLAWGSYLGGPGYDYGSGIATSSDGSVYITGSTLGFNNDVLTGPRDIFVVKLSSSGQQICSKFFGGTDDDYPSDIALDADGNLYVTGTTGSSGWIHGGQDTSYNGGADAFVLKLNNDGERVWSTYLGTENGDLGNSVAIGPGGEVYVTGAASRLITTVDQDHNPITVADSDVFVTHLDESGDVTWSKKFGGNKSDVGDAIAIDTSGNIYVTGETSSRNWTSGGYDTSYNDPLPSSANLYSEGSDGFVLKLDNSGDEQWSTYIGGTRGDHGFDIAVRSGRIYVAGVTSSVSWTSGGYDTAFGGGLTDGFVAKLSTDGDPVWSTYLGGLSDDIGNGIGVDSTGNVYVSGLTASFGWVSGGFDSSYRYITNPMLEFGNGFVAKLNASGDHKWSTYLGGLDSGVGQEIAIHSSGSIYVTGATPTSGWISGGHDSTHNGSIDAYVTKITNSDSASTSTFNISGTANADSVTITRTSTTITANVNDVITTRQLSGLSLINIGTGDGNDTITVADDVIGVAIDSGAGNDRILSTDNVDTIRAGLGDDYIVANEGNDTVYADSGNDSITGSAGKDRLYGESGADRLNGGRGNDTIFGGSGDDRMYGDEDNDSLDGGGNVDRAWGGVGNDTLIGGGSNDKLYGEGGNDRFFGNAGADLINGGSGTDSAKDEDDENLYSSIEVYF